MTHKDLQCLIQSVLMVSIYVVTEFKFYKDICFEDSRIVDTIFCCEVTRLRCTNMMCSTTSPPSPPPLQVCRPTTVGGVLYSEVPNFPSSIQ